MQKIEFRLQNDGEAKTLAFPCTESEYQETIKELCVKNGYVFVREVVEPKGLKFRENTFINLDELNYLAKRLDGFTEREEAKFYAAVETGDYVSTKDLINLTFNQACHTLIRDVSDMESVGKEYVLSSRECITLRELRELDLEKIGRELLSSGKGIPTSYGLLFRNEEVEFEEIYNGKGFPAYYHTGAEALGVEIVNDGERDYIYFPCEKTETDRALKRIGANDISDCEKTIDYTSGGKEWEERFNALLQKNDISSINEIAKAVSPLTANGDRVTENLYKLSAVIEYAGVSDTKDIIRLARCLDEFVYIREVNDDETLGRILAENEFCDIPDSMTQYMDYERYAQDFMFKSGAKYTEHGDVVYLRDDQTLSEILGENDITMGGI